MPVLADSDFTSIERRQRLQDNAAYAADPATARLLSSYQNSYPWMAPDAKWSLAKSGLDPASSAAQAAAYSAAHIETNQGLGFSPVGSPVTRPSGPVDTSSVFAALEQKRQNRYPGPDTGSSTAAGVSPIREIAGDGWSALSPSVQAELNRLTFNEEAPQNAPQDKKYYTIGGYDQLSDAGRAAAESLVRKWADSQKFEGSIESYSTDPGKVFLVAAQPLQIDKPALQIGGFDVGDIGAVTPILRTGGMVLSAPLQELTGQFRNVYELAQSVHDLHPENPNWLQSQSDLGVATGDLLGGRPVDTGSGFFVNPDSGVRNELVRRQLIRGNIGGKPITLGRSFASDVLMLQPGSKPASLLSGLTDASAAIAADPTVWAFKGLSTAREIHNTIGAENSATKGLQAWQESGQVTEGLKAFQEAGGIAGLHPTVTPSGVNTWLDSPDRLPTLQKIADTPDAYTIWRGLGRPDPAIAAQLADATDPAEVAAVLRGHLGTEIGPKFGTNDFGRPSMFGVGSTGAPTATVKLPSRWTAMMPHDVVDGNSLQATATELERAATLLRVPQDQFQAYFDAMARTAAPFQRQGVFVQMMDDTAERLLGKGIGADNAKKLTRMAQERQVADSAYGVQEISGGRGAVTGTPVIDGDPTVLVDSQPMMMAQTVNGDILLPNWRKMRRALGDPRVRAVLENPAIMVGENKLYDLQKMWKGLQITTIKTMIKVIGDEQAGIASRGYVSIINHPVSAASIILGSAKAELPEDAGFLARLRDASAGAVRWGVGHVPGVDPALTATVEGHNFDDLERLQQVAAHGIDASVTDLGTLRANNWQVLRAQPGLNDTEFLNAHARHLAQFAASEDMRGFVRAGSLEQAQDWYWDGPGAEWRHLLATNPAYEGTGLDTVRAVSDEHVAKALNSIQNVTNGNPVLVDMIANGKLGDTPIWNTVRDGSPRISRNYVAALADHQADFPNVTIQEKSLYSADLAKKQLADHFFGRMIHTLLGTPSAVLSKSPLFRQAYWEKIIDTAPFLTADAQAEAVRTAENAANLPDDLLAELKRKIAFGNRSRDPFSGTLELTQADDIAQRHALDIVQRTTHEFSDRSQMFDQLRLLTPFGEVWRKTIKRWISIINQNPNVANRLQQGFKAAMSPDLGEFMGGPAGQGFFHQDSYGQEVFTVPGSEWATQALTGMPVPLVSSVKGLSLGTDIFPALGPVASLPVAWTLDKLHTSKSITEALFPFGSPLDNPGDAWQYAPSWFQKALGHDRPTSPDSVRTFNNSVIDMVRYGITNGDYDTSTPAGIQHAVEDATAKANRLYYIRGAAQFVVPGAPSPEFLLRDKDGHLVDAAALIQKYHDLTDPKVITDGVPGDPNTAGQRFLDKYGADVFKAVTAKSYEYTFGIPTTLDGADWVAAHGDVKRDLPHIFGYFAPPSDPTKFDYGVYRDQLQPGQGRAALSPEQWANLANSRLAALEYGRARDKVDALNNGKAPNDAQRAWLATVKQNLIDQYPGYSDALYGGSGLPGRPDAKLLVLEAQQALDNPTVRDTDAGKGLAAYMTKRSEVDKAWTAAGNSPGSWAQATGSWAIQLRAYLRRFGSLVTADHAQFGPLFDGVFDREMRDDSNPAALTPGG